MENRVAISVTETQAPQPGRSCPLHYRYAPGDLARAADFTADTLYVVGGLYGNVPALHAVLALAQRERSAVTLAFNGDFNWFNSDDASFCAINNEVLRHRVLRGNVETEIAGDDSDAGCGCAYPAHVSDAEVARSNAIATTLRKTARRHPALRARLAALPMNLVANVGGIRVAVVHGDLESLAGWSLAQDALAIEKNINNVKKQIVTSKCRILASSHTCLPVALSLNTVLGHGAIFNNGAAGMPNFRDEPFGMITRIAVVPAPFPVLFGTRIGHLHADAIAARYDHPRWQHEFLANWPAGSSGHVSYHQRITHGPAYSVADANRLNVSNRHSARPTSVT